MTWKAPFLVAAMAITAIPAQAAQPIRAECTVAYLVSVNIFDRPTPAFVAQLRAYAGPRLSEDDAYSMGLFYCRHDQRLTNQPVAAKWLMDQLNMYRAGRK